MAKMYLKKGVDAKKVARRLSKEGLIVHQQLGDGSYVIFKKRTKTKEVKVDRKKPIKPL